jgi:hypothetical protein
MFPSKAKPKIWVDLDNSPHVPFFAPIIEQLRERGFELLVTARDNAQVMELVALHQLECRKIGHDYGRYKQLKPIGIGLRTLRLIPLILRERPNLALSHGSRSQIVLTSLIRIPSVLICDYEHANQGLPGIRARWVIAPEAVPNASFSMYKGRIKKYPGIKEDVYAPRFQPVPGLRAKLGLAEDALMVTLRPPASEAHYHNPKSDRLFSAVVDYVTRHPEARMVILPRNARQAGFLREHWKDLISSGKAIVPQGVVDGLNLIWCSDLVVSGGGTMNREAAALGVPVYSIFRGKIGAVDQYLASSGRLTLVEDEGQVPEKISLVRRQRTMQNNGRDSRALEAIIENLQEILKIEAP